MSENKTLEVELNEIIDRQEDIVLKLFWLHVKSALLAFQNTNVSHEDAYLRYEKLMKMAYKILKSGSGKDDGDIETADKSINEIISEITKILLTLRRKITIEISI